MSQQYYPQQQYDPGYQQQYYQQPYDPGYQQQQYYPPQQQYYPPVPPVQDAQPAPAPTKKKDEDSFTKKYFYWFTPAMGIWFFLAFIIIILSIFTVGCSVSSVPDACATWSLDCATSQE